MRLFCILVAVGLAASSAVAGECPPEKLASFDLSLTPEGKPIVPIQIGDRTVPLKLDSGGLESMLTDEVVRTLNLPRGTITTQWMSVGNDKIDHYTMAHDVTFGGRHMGSLSFLIMPDGHLESGIGGTLGPNLLRQYGVELDFGGGKVNLFSTKACVGSLAYWTQSPASETPISLWRIGPITTKVTVDGKIFTAIVETGSAETLLPLETAQRLGMVTDETKLKPVPGSPGYFTYPFGSLSFENGPSLAGPSVILVRHDTQKFDEEMTLGMDVLRKFHIYIAYGRQVMVMTPASAH